MGMLKLGGKQMFTCSKEEVLNYYMKYPLEKGIPVKKMMPFVIASAYPMMNDKERMEMDVVKQQYDIEFQRLATTMHKKKTAMICMQLLYQAIDLYDHAFDRLANSYFESIYN